MSLDCIREAADGVRSDPCIQEFRTTQLTIRSIRWTGGRIGAGSKEIVSELVMLKYQVKQIGAREIASSGGRLQAGDVRVLDISPSYLKSDGSGTGGYTTADLDPQQAWMQPDYAAPVQTREVEYILTGDISGVYRLVNVNSDDPVSWSLILRNTRKSP